MSRRTTSALLLSALALGCTACGGDEETTPTSSTSQPSVEQQTTETVSVEEDARDRVKGTVAAYFSSADGVYHAPEADPEATTMTRYAAGSALVSVRSRATSLIAEQRYQQGSTRVRDLKIRSLSLTYEPNATKPKIPTAELTGCIDRSQISVLEAGTDTTVADPSVKSVRATFTVRNEEWPSVTGWRLAWYEESKTTC